MKKALALVLTLSMLVVLAACGGGANAAVAGTYKGEKAKFVGDTEWVTDEEFSIELKANGTGSFNREDTSFDLTWKLDGETFTMQEKFLGITNDYTGTLKDGVLDIFNGEPDNDLTYEYVLKLAE